MQRVAHLNDHTSTVGAILKRKSSDQEIHNNDKLEQKCTPLPKHGTNDNNENEEIKMKDEILVQRNKTYVLIRVLHPQRCFSHYSQSLAQISHKKEKPRNITPML